MIQDTTTLNADITIEEVRFALTSSSKGKALGEDGVPLEVLLNEECTVTKLFNVCFGISAIPDIWSRGIINPIIKDVNGDHCEPLNYRGITISSAVDKVFCSILNRRSTRVIESCNGIGDEEHGFRAGRNTGDYLSTISLTIESRIKKKLDTYVTFIDFSKAYDRIDR